MDVTRISDFQVQQAQPQAADTAQANPQAVSAQPPAPPVTVEGSTPGQSTENAGGELLQRAVMEINSSIAAHGRHLSVQMHAATGRHVVTVYNSDTNEVVREIPPARVLDAHASVLAVAGLLVDTRG